MGDLLVLAEGDAVGADARLSVATDLRVLEASLTGESEPALNDAATLKSPAALGDRLNRVFMGTSVAQGSAQAIVTALGMQSVVGTIATLLDATADQPTPLQLEVARTGRVLGLAAVGIALVVVVVHLPFLNQAFGTAPLSLVQWGVCGAMASGVLWFSELRKWALRVCA